MSEANEPSPESRKPRLGLTRRWSSLRESAEFPTSVKEVMAMFAAPLLGHEGLHTTLEGQRDRGRQTSNVADASPPTVTALEALAWGLYV